jgi:hypothetical protein
MVPRTPDQTGSTAPASIRLGPWRARLVVAWFMAVLLAPGLAMIAGARPQNIEERSLATMPAIEAEALLTTAFYAAIDRFLVDNFPLREAATAAFARLAYGVLDTSPSDQVVAAEGDWLYFIGELRPTCTYSGAQLADQATTIEAALAARDRRLVLAIAPDKHSIYPETLGQASRLGTPCSDAQRASLRARAASSSFIADLWAPILAAREADPDTRLYWHQDSHWTPAAAILGVQAIVDRIDGSVWDPADVVSGGTTLRPAELARLMGIVANEEGPAVRVNRQIRITDVVLDEGAPRQGDTVHEYTVTGTAPLIRGTTVIVYDSFLGIVRPLVVPWFERSIWIHVSDLAEHPELADLAAGFDTLVLETVERQAYTRDITKVLRPFVELDPGTAPVPAD